MPSKHRLRIALLITLVLCTVVLSAGWASSQAEARGLLSPGASSILSPDKPDASVTSGEPDLGGGVTPPPPSVKKAKQCAGSGSAGGRSFIGWARWTSRIWATLYPRAGR